MKTLVIVESPTKAKTISKFLGKGFIVESSFGHIRDLPEKKMGVDLKNGTFLPEYVVEKAKQKTVNKIKEAAKKSNEIIFATDEDREGEAIAWHLAFILKIDPEKAQRIVFHEITKNAIENALASPRQIDQKLVDAQQARRVLDRLVGYELSPFLWKKVAKGLSAGRVQSVAVRLIVERERERQNFKSEEYWTITGKFFPPRRGELKGGSLTAQLYAIDNKKLDKFDLKTKEQTDAILENLKNAEYAVSDIKKSENKRTPPPPFTTSTLQQQANHKLGYSSKQTMMLAQQLYEVGLITYMRTDSTNLSTNFAGEAQQFIKKEFGDKYALDKFRFYKTKSKGAQEAHEAIRPTDIFRTPDSVKDYLSAQQLKLYTLIWNRALATQMNEARLNKTTIDIINLKSEILNLQSVCTFRSNGQTMIFDGWMKLYPEMINEEILPELEIKDKVDCQELKPEQHFTEPPARYSDATLVKIMEEYGIGRPSTYAPTIATIEGRKYVERDENKRLKPTEIAFIVNDLLVNHFSQIVDYKFTAQMEENLDEIAEGKKDWQPIISTFYHPFHENLVNKTSELSKKELTEEKTDEICDKCGAPMVSKTGRYGRFLACSAFPKCKNTKPLNGNGKNSGAEMTDETCDKCGAPMVMRKSRYGKFLGCSKYPECKNIKKISKSTNPSE